MNILNYPESAWEEEPLEEPTERDQALHDAVQAIYHLFEISTTLGEVDDAHWHCTKAIVNAEKAAKAGRW